MRLSGDDMRLPGNAWHRPYTNAAYFGNAILVVSALLAFALSTPADCSETTKTKSEGTAAVPSAAALPGSAPSTSTKLVKGFQIKQLSCAQGSVTVYMCPHKWALRTSLISINVDEDKDEVIAYTKQTNKYLLDSIEVGVKRFKGFQKSGDFAWGPYKQIGKDNYLGRPVLVMERKGKRLDMHAKNDVVITEQEQSCPGIKLCKTFQIIAFCIFDLDFANGMPLKVTRAAYSPTNRRYCTMHPVNIESTTSIKEMAFPQSEFEIPKGLTRVKTEVDLFNDDSGLDVDIAGRSSQILIRKRERQLQVEQQH